MKCPFCGENLDSNIRFCPSCGDFVGTTEELDRETLNLIYMRADLSGFTRMSESMIAEDVMSFINEVFGIFSEIIESYKGVIYQVIGDEVVSVFGYPKTSGFAPHMAIFAAEDMLKKLNELNKKEYLKNPVGLKIGMAKDATTLFNVRNSLLNSVIVTKGFFKSQILQKNAEENTVLVCEHLYAATKAFFSYTEIGEFVKDGLTVMAYEYKMKI
jgi:class 3 adenylate cyclase